MMHKKLAGELHPGQIFWRTPQMGGPGEVVQYKTEYFVYTTHNRGYAKNTQVFISEEVKTFEFRVSLAVIKNLTEDGLEVVDILPPGSKVIREIASVKVNGAALWYKTFLVTLPNPPAESVIGDEIAVAVTVVPYNTFKPEGLSERVQSWTVTGPTWRKFYGKKEN